MDHGLPGSSVHGILQSRMPFPSPGDLPDPGIKSTSPESPALVSGPFITEPPGAPIGWVSKQARDIPRDIMKREKPEWWSHDLTPQLPQGGRQPEPVTEGPWLWPSDWDEMWRWEVKSSVDRDVEGWNSDSLQSQAPLKADLLVKGQWTKTTWSC